MDGDEIIAISDRDSAPSKPTYSCWDELGPAWLIDPIQFTDDRIYVHGEILEWIIAHINENLLNENLRANVEEVHHHNLDGQVYLITFYLKKSTPFGLVTRARESLNSLTTIKYQLSYRMTWMAKPTYFLRIDSDFNDRKLHILKRLQNLNLHDAFVAKSLDVNWMYIPKIEIYEFYKRLPEQQIDEISSIFEEISESRAALYICGQFSWHREVYSYVEVDKMAMDMCVEVWRRYDLLNDFAVDEILRLDLANKDYRDPYFNEYLDKYLDILLKNCLPPLQHHSEEPSKILEVPCYKLDKYLCRYFISRFYNRIASISFKHFNTTRFHFDETCSHDIPIVKHAAKLVHLKDGRPHPDQLINMNGHSMTYKISNYSHFSNSLFRALLNKVNINQSYIIKFDKEFNFKYDSPEQYSSQLPANWFKWSSGKKMITIILENGIERNADKLANFVKYLINLFDERRKLHEEVSLKFVNCLLEDFSFLDNVANIIEHVQFERMNISSRQLGILSCALAQLSCVNFFDCAEITDHDVMTLLENIDFDRLWIEGKNSCTPVLYFLMAEHLMDKEDVDIIEANRFARNMQYSKYNFFYNFEDIEFFKNDHQIVARNHNTKDLVDIYCLINSIKED